MKLTDSPPAPKPRAAFGSLISHRQKQILAMEAADAFQRLDSLHGIIVPPEVERSARSVRMDYWRHQQTLEVTGRVESFTEVQQSEYRPLLEHFQKLSGKLGGAFNTALREIKNAAMHSAPGCEYVRDLWHWAGLAGLGADYVATVRRAKFQRRDMEQLTTAELKQLHDTIVNRARAKLEKGDPANRNKLQRRSRAGQGGDPL